MQPRRRRGRKPSNLSAEEKRRRRLERGRVAANKCRQKKRELEMLLEQRAQDLLAERNRMMKENTGLKLELQGLIDEVLEHSKGACGGIPEAVELLRQMPSFMMPLRNPFQTQPLPDLGQSLAGFATDQAPTSIQTPTSYQATSAFQPVNVSGDSLDQTLAPGPPDNMMDMFLGNENNLPN